MKLEKENELLRKKLENKEKNFKVSIESLCELAGIEEPATPTMGVMDLAEWIRNNSTDSND